MKTDGQNLKPKRQTASEFKLGYGDYLRFRDLVLERSGLHFPEKKKIDLETGLVKALTESPFASENGQYNLDGYYQLLCDKTNPSGRSELDRLIKMLTIGETYFFRDEAQFKALAIQVLPALIARKRAAAAAVGPNIQPQLRIWSAGCATGEEPYSLAILLKELLPDIGNWHILILATDINQDSLDRAQEAVYSEWSFREARAKSLRSTYFTQDQTNYRRYRLRHDVRRMVTFASLNLIEDDYPAIHNNTVSMDLILCRNVTIYFTERTTREVIKRFYEALVEGGWLVVGHSEPSLVTYQAFQVRNFPDTLLYQKTGQPSPWPADWDWPTYTSNESDLTDQNHSSGTIATSSMTELSLPLAPTPNSKPGPLFPPSTENTVSSPWQATTSESSSSTRFGSLSNSQSRSKSQAISAASEDSYQTALTLLNQGFIEKAVIELQRKLTVNPDFAPAHSLLGKAYANLGQWPEARRWCQKAIELDSLSGEAYYTLAQVYQHENQLEPAIEMLKKAIYLNRDAPLLYFNLAMLYRKMAQVNKARQACQNAIRILEKWPPERIVPDSDETMAGHLLTVARRVATELEQAG